MPLAVLARAPRGSGIPRIAHGVSARAGRGMVSASLPLGFASPVKQARAHSAARRPARPDTRCSSARGEHIPSPFPPGCRTDSTTPTLGLTSRDLAQEAVAGFRRRRICCAVVLLPFRCPRPDRGTEQHLYPHSRGERPCPRAAACGAAAPLRKKPFSYPVTFTPAARSASSGASEPAWARRASCPRPDSAARSAKSPMTATRAPGLQREKCRLRFSAAPQTPPQGVRGERVVRRAMSQPRAARERLLARSETKSQQARSTLLVQKARARASPLCTASTYVPVGLAVGGRAFRATDAGAHGGERGRCCRPSRRRRARQSPTRRVRISVQQVLVFVGVRGRLAGCTRS